MKLRYRSIPYHPQSTSLTSSVPHRFLKYRCFSYSSQRSEKPKEAFPQKMIYRGVSYYKYGSEVLTNR